MSNQSLLNSIKIACEKFEEGKMSLSGLQSSIEGNGRALEGQPRKVYSQLHSFCNDLEELEFTCLEGNQYEEGCKVVKKLKEFLEHLSRQIKI